MDPPSAPVTTLPFELITIIINLVTDDKPTLYALTVLSTDFHRDVIRLLYASTPPLYLKWAHPSAISGMRFLSRPHSSRHHSLELVREATVITVPKPNTISIRVVINELHKMTNLTHLIFETFNGVDGSEDAEIPSILHKSRFGFRLKQLTWKGSRIPDSLSLLCVLLDAHRDTLEAVDVMIDKGLRNISQHMQDGTISTVRRVLYKLKANYSSTTTSTNQEPLIKFPRLRELSGSMDVLDIFLPLIAAPETLRTVRQTFPRLASYPRTSTPRATPERVIAFIQQAAITTLSLDVSKPGWLLDICELMASMPLLKSLEIRSMWRDEPMDVYSIFSPLQELSSLTVSMRVDLDHPPSYSGKTDLERKIMHHFKPCGLMPSVFAYCKNLRTVRMELEGPSVSKTIWQIWLRKEGSSTKVSKYPVTSSSSELGEILAEWGDFEQYPDINLFTYMGTSI